MDQDQYLLNESISTPGSALPNAIFQLMVGQENAYQTPNELQNVQDSETRESLIELHKSLIQKIQLLEHHLKQQAAKRSDTMTAIISGLIEKAEIGDMSFAPHLIDDIKRAVIIDLNPKKPEIEAKITQYINDKLGAVPPALFLKGRSFCNRQIATLRGSVVKNTKKQLENGLFKDHHKEFSNKIFADCLRGISLTDMDTAALNCWGLCIRKVCSNLAASDLTLPSLWKRIDDAIESKDIEPKNNAWIARQCSIDDAERADALAAWANASNNDMAI